MKMFKFMKKGKAASKAAKVLVMLAAAGIIVYSVMEMTKEKTKPKPKVGAARWYPPTTTMTPEVSRPMSTPTMLASKNGLGGGAFVNSQSLKLGGSSFTGRKVTFDEYGFRNHQPWPLYKPEPAAVPVPAPGTAPVAPASMAPLGRRSGPSGGSAVTRRRAATDIVIETRDGYIVQPRA
jgi:hypothetical protein